MNIEPIFHINTEDDKAKETAEKFLTGSLEFLDMVLDAQRRGIDVDGTDKEQPLNEPLDDHIDPTPEP